MIKAEATLCCPHIALWGTSSFLPHRGTAFPVPDFSAVKYLLTSWGFQRISMTYVQKELATHQMLTLFSLILLISHLSNFFKFYQKAKDPSESSQFSHNHSTWVIIKLRLGLYKEKKKKDHLFKLHLTYVNTQV